MPAGVQVGALKIEEGRKVKATRAVAAQKGDGSVVLTPPQAYIHHNEGSRQVAVQKRGEIPHIGNWTDQNAWVEWSFKIERPGRFEVWADLAVEQAQSRFLIGLPKQQTAVEVAATGGYDQFVKKRIGELVINQAGDYTLQMNPDPDP